MFKTDAVWWLDIEINYSILIFYIIKKCIGIELVN